MSNLFHPLYRKTYFRTSHNERSPVELSRSGFRKAAAAYSPTWWGSTIGAGAFNFSVRDGKRWFHTAITAAVCYLREILIKEIRLLKRFRAISTGRLNTLLCVHLLPINVVVSHDPVRKSHLEDGFALRCFQRLS